MKKLALACLAFAALIMLNSCKDDKPDGIEGTWKITAATFNPPVTISGTTYTDAYAYLFSQSCVQDNLFIFKENNVVIQDEGVSKCSPSDIQQSSGTYLLSGSNLTIYNGDTAVFTNVSVDEDHLKGTIPTESDSATTTINITWSRQ